MNDDINMDSTVSESVYWLLSRKVEFVYMYLGLLFGYKT
jgi:hypothetical protein